ncbi:glycoside hydrolase family 19 protein [Paracidovorax valerianellae]|uniref:Chitinase class I n=2 Tax=Paracidovorax valerianellae TaxID=187868 RepID=A0A1G6VPB7_9BURK|nr:glycoside hydrolase family 19 protein [Paracidovorax valerianellae]MDA8447056.1 glycoside hydrolase [Paracidovorax valerianellae]SDD55381.1 Chitinase class I [Paracidovorax valerianellae]
MSAPQKTNYHHIGPYNKIIFQAEFIKQFSTSGRYNAAAIPDMLNLLSMIERDTNINDVRQAAYMLATAMWETTSPISITKIAKNKKGQPLLDKNKNPVILKQKKWLMTMAPVNEIGQGKGRKYHEPVKVKLMPDGWTRITEQDGDQFKISDGGAISPLTKGAKMGTKDGGAASKTYDNDDGSEHAYFGRGYVQLTWWSNYATAGIAIGRGLTLLNDPELVKTPEIAYALMSYGMRTGKGFANGHRFSQYFSGDATNYASARRMVNGSDHAEDISQIAKKIEAALLKARPNVNTPLSVKP